MLRVNLHLLRMLQNLMTALKDKHVHTMYNAAVASVTGINFFFHYFSNKSSEALYEVEHH